MIRYAVYMPNKRKGEFEFLCSTQNHLTTSLEKAKQEVNDLIDETIGNYDPPLTRKEALEELGGEPVIYKLTMEKM